MKRLLKYHRYKMNASIFVIAYVLFLALTIISLFYAFAQEEGTLGDQPFDNFLANSFYVWRFPLHNILCLLEKPLPFLGVLYLPLLLLNPIVYSILLERLITILRHSDNSKR